MFVTDDRVNFSLVARSVCVIGGSTACRASCIRLPNPLLQSLMSPGSCITRHDDVHLPHPHTYAG